MPASSVPKHIVIDARIINSTTGRYVERLLFHLQTLDKQNIYTVLVREKDQTYWKPTNKNFSIKVAEFKNYSFSEQLGLYKLLRSINADLVHFCTPEQPVLYRGNKVTTIHDLTLLKTYNPDKNWIVYHFKQFVGKFVFRNVAHTSNFVITPSEYTRQEVIHSLHAVSKKVVRTHLAAESVSAHSEPVKLPSKNFIFFVGQQSGYKNIVRLAEAHQTLLIKHPDLQLVLVGKIDSPAQKNKILFERRHYKNIIFTGFVSDSQLNWLYKHAQCYVFPSLMEGFGLPGLEAMVQLCPLVSSSATCLPEVYGNAAHYFDPEQVNDIVKAIDEVIVNKALRKQLITNGKTRVKQYSWKTTAQKTLAVYERALTNSSEQ